MDQARGTIASSVNRAPSFFSTGFPPTPLRSTDLRGRPSYFSSPSPRVLDQRLCAAKYPPPLGVVKEEVAVLVVLVRRHCRAVGAVVRWAVGDEVPGAVEEETGPAAVRRVPPPGLLDALVFSLHRRGHLGATQNTARAVGVTSPSESPCCGLRPRTKAEWGLIGGYDPVDRERSLRMPRCRCGQPGEPSPWTWDYFLESLSKPALPLAGASSLAARRLQARESRRPRQPTHRPKMGWPHQDQGI